MLYAVDVFMHGMVCWLRAASVVAKLFSICEYIWLRTFGLVKRGMVLRVQVLLI